MKMVELQEALERVGLSSNEAKVYLSLLKTGSNKAGAISRECGINRTTTYDALERLLEKGLASFIIKANRKWFEAVDPVRLIEFLEEKKSDVKDIMPGLIEMKKMPKERESVTLYHGYRGMKSVFQDMLDEAKVHYVMDSEGQLIEKMPHFAQYFIKQVEKKNIQIKHIVRRGIDVKPTSTTTVKFIDKKTKSDAVINIYKDKVAILIWTEPPEAVVIKNGTVADSFRDYFNLIWSKK
jgi:sugar-specific transcriptional regulator TrmB